MNTRPRRRNADTTHTETTYKQVNGIRGPAGPKRAAEGGERAAVRDMRDGEHHNCSEEDEEEEEEDDDEEGEGEEAVNDESQAATWRGP